MYPQMKGSTYYFPIPGGLFFQSAEKALPVEGQDLPQMLAAIIPLLDGCHALEEIVGCQPLEQQDSVKKLITFLHEQEFIKDGEHSLPHHLSAAELRIYAPDIAFIDASMESAPAQFERYRQSHILIIGSGLTVTALVGSTMYSGVHGLDVILTQESPVDDSLQNYLNFYRTRDEQLVMTLREAPSWQDAESVKQTLLPFDAVLYISDRPDLERVDLLNQLCLGLQKIFLPAVVIDNTVYVGPLSQPKKSSCWKCAWQELRHHADPVLQSLPIHTNDLLTKQRSRFLTRSTAALVANFVSFDVFKCITGAGPLETDEHLLRIPLSTFQSTRYAIMSHKYALLHNDLESASIGRERR